MNHLKTIPAFSLIMMAAFLVACGKEKPATETTSQTASNETAAEHKAITTEKLEPYECGDITRLHTYNGIFLASQPGVEDFEQAKAGGVQTVINLRTPEENKDFNEQEVIEGLGLKYHNVAVAGPDEMTDEKIDEVLGLLRDGERPILMHCASANRVGAMWLAYRVLDGGLTYDDALAEAKIVGLKSPVLEEKAKGYIERHEKAE